jgi:hypothetical protein
MDHAKKKYTHKGFLLMKRNNQPTNQKQATPITASFPLRSTPVSPPSTALISRISITSCSRSAFDPLRRRRHHAMAGAEATSTSSSSACLPPALPASRQDIQAAVAKAAELRALHAALLQGGANAGASFASASRSPAAIRLPPAASPAHSRAGVAAPAAAEDYPVFAPVSDASNSWQPCVHVLQRTVSWHHGQGRARKAGRL